MFEQLHAYVSEAVMEMRRRLGETNLPSFRFDIEVSGRTLSGDIKIAYRLRESYSDGVSGARLAPVIDEFLRRKGWEARNSPLALPAPPDDEIQF